MKFSHVVAISSLALVAQAAPASRSIFSSLFDVLVLDAPAFQDPSDSSNTLASMEAYMFLHEIDISPLTSALASALDSLGIDIGDKIDTALDRLKLFAAIGIPGVHVTVDVTGCSQSAELLRTSFSDLGIVNSNASFGACTEGAPGFVATAEDYNDYNSTSATIFPSGTDGFGVISDIDDTVKISHVLDTVKLIQATLIDDPEPVAGMPELYASLAQSLNSPQFIYLSGSPIQLYPFLHDFIDTTFSASKGPLLLQNFTLTDPSILLNALSSDDGAAKIEYKVGQINRIAGMYPKKSFLAIGDSTEKDPEVYGESFNIHGGNFIRCIWIHLVDGANNTDERFAAALEGVPSNRIRLYNDTEIPSLESIDVAGGDC